MNLGFAPFWGDEGREAVLQLDAREGRGERASISGFSLGKKEEGKVPMG